MATEREISRASRMHDYTTTDDEDDVVEDSELEHDEEQKEKQQRGGELENDASCTRRSYAGRVVDPREKWVQEWNRVFLLVCAAGLFVDPLFFYALSISDSCMCLFVDGWFAVTVTVLRCMTDALHLWNILLRFKMAKRSFGFGGGTGAAADAGSSVALRYLKSRRGFFFDFFVILPIPQSSQVLRDGVKSCCMLGPGNFSGDELLSWCLRRPFIERLPLSSSTLITLETTEAFGQAGELGLLLPFNWLGEGTGIA